MVLYLPGPVLELVVVLQRLLFVAVIIVSLSVIAIESGPTLFVGMARGLIPISFAIRLLKDRDRRAPAGQTCSADPGG